MHAALKHFQVLNHPAPGQSGSGPVGAAQPLAAQVVASSDILQGQRAVGILHNGAVYRLQATRLGKLILTK